jgi:hypothetical protein
MISDSSETRFSRSNGKLTVFVTVSVSWIFLFGVLANNITCIGEHQCHIKVFFYSLSLSL